jgi:hypothetical protein
MEYVMRSKLFNPLAKAIGVFAIGVLATACSNDNNTSATNTSTKTVTQMPWEALTVPDLNGLSAYIILDGDAGSHIPMTIDTSLHTASASIPGLPKTSHTVQIVYEYNDAGTIYTVARSSVHTVDLTSGSTTFNIPNTDYVTTGTDFDPDSDGLSNAYELAAGTNPGDASCVVGISLVGSCTL